MLYEVITFTVLIIYTYKDSELTADEIFFGGFNKINLAVYLGQFRRMVVITSYSIHYTKLYE